ncbi:MAG: type I-E CRISPR-associated endonuclease Cas1e [Candidatus Helarchaeota archaeon]
MKNFQILPKIKDCLSFIYIEHAKIERDKFSISIFTKDGKIPVPCASISCIMLGPGTTISHEAVKILADNGCMILWCGENNIRLYAYSTGKTNSSKNLIKQAFLVNHPKYHLMVVRKMYMKRFNEDIPLSMTLQQIRGKEGARVRNAYKKASLSTGIKWEGRRYNKRNWSDTDPVNTAISVGNSCLYGVSAAAIVALGYSTALGFIHTGTQLSFVYDIADLYKMDLIIPLAFKIVRQSDLEIERRMRIACRNIFKQTKLLKQIVSDLNSLLYIEEAYRELKQNNIADLTDSSWSSDDISITYIWDTEKVNLKGGTNFDDQSI